MTKRHFSTKQSLIASILVLAMCFSALIGTTFAWFTDSVTSAGNIIKTGTLDVSLEHSDTKLGVNDAGWIDASTGAIFNYSNWEPGYTMVKYVKIENEGSLDLKFVLNIIPNEEAEEVNLADVIEVYMLGENATFDRDDLTAESEAYVGNLTSLINYAGGAASGVLYADDADKAGNVYEIYAIALKMSEDAGNEYMNKSVGGAFTVQLLATQYTSEYDSFGKDYDADAEYPVNIIVSKPVTVDSSNKLSEAVNINYTDDFSTVSSVTVTVPAGAQLDAGAEKLVLSVKEADGVDPTVQITSNQAAKTYNISLEGLASNNDKDIEIVLNIEKGLVDVQLYHKDALVPDATYDPVTGKLSFKTKGFSPFTVVSATKLFVAGDGSAENPYIIEKPEDMLNISKYYHEYKYYKVADGVKTLDMTGIGRLRLNGSFDGNGVTINNLTTALFENVGKVGVEQDIKISNLTANVNTTDGRAFVRNVINPGTTTFANVALHGYIEGQYNMGSFYNYGAANASGCEGANYTVCFVNATSDVTLVCISGNSIGGMLGHGYEGSNYKLSINMDDASKYTGKMYTTGTATCYQVMAMCSHATYVLNGVETSRYDDKYSSTKLTLAAPSAQADGYYVVPVDGVEHYVVSLEAQLTAYDKNCVKLANQAGLTWSLGKETLTSGFDAKIFDLIQSAEIVNDKDIKTGYKLDNGALKVYTGRDLNFASGWITLNVTQYDAEGNILATGNVRVHTFAEPAYVSTADELKAALANGGNIVLLNDVTVTDYLTMNKSCTLYLNGKTLYMSTTDDSKISSAANVIIKNGNVDISGVNFTEHNGIFNITGGAANTLTVENVNFYGDGFTSYSVFWIAKASSGINTLNLVDSKFELKNEAYASGGFIKHPSGGENCSAINITNSVLDFENVTRLFLYGAYNIKDSEISFVDTTGEANGLRQGQFTIDNSKITITGGDKGISPRYGDTVIKNGSVVTINNTKGNDVIFEYDFDVVVDSSSTFTYGTTSGTAGGQVVTE